MERILDHSKPVGVEHGLMGLLVRLLQVLGWGFALEEFELHLGLDQLAAQFVYHFLHLLW